MSNQLTTERRGSTLVLTIRNPEVRNALSPAMSISAIEALEGAESDDTVRSVILTGEGRHFCAGGNLNQLLANRQHPKEVQTKSIDALHGWIEAISAFPKPVIAAVEGAAAGAGFSLALACDFIVAAENAVFVMAYSNVALSPDGGGSWALARALPKQLAARAMMLGEKLTATTLHHHGLIYRLTPTGQALNDAMTLADVLNARAGNALATIKELIQVADDHTLHQHLALEKHHFVENLHHANGAIGIESFLKKSIPRYL